MNKEELFSELAIRLKQLQYRKQNLTWRKKSDEITIVFNIQNSSFSKDDFYISLGVYLHELGDTKNPKIYDCQVQQRIDSIYDVDKLINILLLWEEWYGTLERLKSKARANKMPAMTTVKAITYLTTI